VVLDWDSLRKEGVLESFGKSIDLLKVVDFIRLTFSQDTVLDKLEDNFANFRAARNPPIVKHGLCHGTKLL
jgi:hypothetical protein